MPIAEAPPYFHFTHLPPLLTTCPARRTRKCLPNGSRKVHLNVVAKNRIPPKKVVADLFQALNTSVLFASGAKGKINLSSFSAAVPFFSLWSFPLKDSFFKNQSKKYFSPPQIKDHSTLSQQMNGIAAGVPAPNMNWNFVDIIDIHWNLCNQPKQNIGKLLEM